jgi:hypothetical protein
VATFDLDVPDSLPTLVTIWATGDPDLPVRGVAALMTLLTALSAPELVVVYDDLASQGLRPIQVDLVREFGVLELTTTFRLLDLERRKPPRSLFAVPPAYTERKLPR